MVTVMVKMVVEVMVVVMVMTVRMMKTLMVIGMVSRYDGYNNNITAVYDNYIGNIGT